MLSKIKCFSIQGITGYDVEIEADVSNGMPAFDIVGLADTAVKESKERVRAAIKNNGFEFPVKRVTVNLAPAFIKKEGSSYDLPIAIGILISTKQFSIKHLDNYGFIGELSLDGSLKPVNGVLPMAVRAANSGIEALIVPHENAFEAAVVGGIQVFPAKNIGEIIKHFSGGEQIARCIVNTGDVLDSGLENHFDFADVKGQEKAKRALEIAASGGHNCMMVGPPGSGKTMLAKRLPSILPPLTYDEAVEVSMIHSVAGILPPGLPLVAARPFRNPLSSVSAASLTGGGKNPKPGEISLAHNGVLFLDELPEFGRDALDVLRQPLEDGVVTVSRVNSKITYPAKTTLICAANPCKCGYYLSDVQQCTCSETDVRKYFGKISGPLLDRIDIHIEVPLPEYDTLNIEAGTEGSAEIRRRVQKSREIQMERYRAHKIYANSQLEGKQIEMYCVTDERSKALLRVAYERMGLSARAHSRILKVARTIADMEQSEHIREDHIAEAISYRSFDRRGGLDNGMVRYA